MWASYSGRLYSLMQRLLYQAVAIAKPVSPILWRSQSCCAAMVCKCSWLMGSGQAMPNTLALLSGSAQRPADHSWDSSAEPLHRCCAESILLHGKLQTWSLKSRTRNQKSKMNLKTAIWKLRISKLKCETGIWTLKHAGLRQDTNERCWTRYTS